MTSTSLLANGAAFPAAVRLARAHPTLGVGVHLNLVEGRPVAPPGTVATLLSRGRFPGSAVALALRCWLGRVDRNELVRELSAQIRKVVDAGLRPTHIDSHMHGHCLPAVLGAAVEAAARFGIRRARCPIERRAARGPPTAPRRGSRLRSAVVSRLAAGGREHLARAGVDTTDYFIGPRLMGSLDAPTLAHLIRHLPRGTTELMCHPALGASARSHIARDQELAALTSAEVRAMVEARSIALVSFADLYPREQVRQG